MLQHPLWQCWDSQESLQHCTLSEMFKMIYSSLFSLTELKKLSKNQQVCKYLIKGEYYLELYN